MRTVWSPRRLIALLSSTAILAGVLAVAAPPAGAVQVPPVLVVCPDNGSTYPLAVSQTGCSTLQAALTNATVASDPETIELMPGDYCPVTIPYGISDLTLAGAGQAGLDLNGNPTVNGWEASLSTIKWTAACSATAPAAAIDVSAGHYAGPDGFGGSTTLTFQNLAVAGSASGPGTGIETGGGGNFAFRDVLVQNFTGTGIDFEATSAGAVQLAASALVGNGTGLTIDNTVQGTPDVSEIDETTIAANTRSGLVATAGPVQLHNDTIANNTVDGVDLTAAGSLVNSENSIVADNGTDCDVGGYPDVQFHWEPTAAADNGSNLTGSTCSAGDSGDVNTFATALPAPTDLGGPTPAIQAPGAAVGSADPAGCNSTGADQREALYTANQPCDIGAVDATTANLNANGSASPGAETFPTLAQGIADTEPIVISNQGGGLLGISSVAVTGTGFSIVDDQCSYRSLLPAAANSCTVEVQFAPTAPTGGFSGSLTLATADGGIPTTTGQTTVSLSGTASGTANPPNPPTKVALLAADHAINVGWTPASGQSGNATITGYQVDYATSATPASWTVSTVDTNPNESSNVISGLTDGTAYFVRVGATSSIGTTWSTVAGPATPTRPLDPTTWSAPASRSVKYGATATVSATLTDSGTNDVLGSMAVTLRGRPGRTGAFTVVREITTTSAGLASVAIKPTRTTQYEWVYAGDGTRHAATSAVATVQVAQVVRAALANKRVARSATVKVYGTVSPSATGKTVRLEEKVAGRWKTVGVAAKIRKQKLPNHVRTVGYVLSLKASKKGKLTLRVVRAATSSCLAGTSARVVVTVR